MIGFAAAALATLTASALLLPHARLHPVTGISVWLAVLCVRALAVVTLAMMLASYLPATQLFEKVTGWCLHTAIPYLSAHFEVSGHRFGELATLLPSLALALSVIAAVFAAWRAGRAVRRWLSAATIARGPRRSVVIAGPEVIVAATGLGRGRIVISAGALALLDEEELAAGLAHEQGHIDRRHSYVALAAHLLFCLGRPLPGSRTALRELLFHLERDADEFAVGRTGDPLALATTIGKAASPPIGGERVGLTGLSGAETPMRMRMLLNRRDASPSPLISGVASLLAAALLLTAIALVTPMPDIAAAAVGHAAVNVGLDCQQ